MANKDRLTRVFLDLLSINSPSRNERGVADYVKAKFAGLGFEVEEDDAASQVEGTAGNIIAFKRGTVAGSKGIFFSCHMDTVEPTEGLKVVVEDGVIRSDGTTILGADDKAGIAAVIEGIESVLESGAPYGDIRVLLDVCEENGLLGAKTMDLSKVQGCVGYVFDSGMPTAGIVVSAPSHENMSIEITGRAAHAGIAPEEGVSAIIAASNAISRMNLGRIDEETTANVGVIQGGKARNIIPDKVNIRAEARSRSEDKLVAQVRHIKACFEEEAAKVGAVAVMESVREYTAFCWTENDAVVKLAAEACRRIGIAPRLVDGGGGSDANVFNLHGLPSVVVGVGYQSPHSPAERIAVEDLVTSAEYARALIEVAAGMGG